MSLACLLIRENASTYIVAYVMIDRSFICHATKVTGQTEAYETQNYILLILLCDAVGLLGARSIIIMMFPIY